jgi:hypothetical protein
LGGRKQGAGNKLEKKTAKKKVNQNHKQTAKKKRQNKNYRIILTTVQKKKKNVRNRFRHRFDCMANLNNTPLSIQRSPSHKTHNFEQHHNNKIFGIAKTILGRI